MNHVPFARLLRSDRRSRLLGLFGYITHTFFFFRQQSWWSALLQWVSWIGLAMCLTGAVVGVWRYGLSARFRHKGLRSHSPYVGWMKWHHYAGLLFGVLTITWVFSGLVSLDVIPPWCPRVGVCHVMRADWRKRCAGQWPHG